MRIKTALGDFVKTTLASVPGYWQKLVYLAELRRSRTEGNAEYDHWGMKRRYGVAASVAAMGSAHTDVFLSILRTPVKTLLSDLRTSAAQQQRSEQEYLERLREQQDTLLPADDGGGSAPHFDLTVKTLESLVRAESAGRAEATPAAPAEDRRDG